MGTNRAAITTRPRTADGYLLVEAIVGVVLLGVGALGVAAALGQAEQLAAVAAQRDREAGVRADLAAVLAFGLAGASGWQPAGFAADAGAASSGAFGGGAGADGFSGAAACWCRVSSVSSEFVWIEARCGVGVDDLPADQREPGLLVRR